MKTIKTLLIAVLILFIGAVGFAYSGLYDVSASSPHSSVVNWFLSTTSHASIERHAKKIVVPDLSDDSLALAGVNDFEAMCTGCHGAPGQEPEAVGQGLNPPAPDLAEVAAHSTPAELFWVTKHGIRMTGMPAWGASHDDEAIWPVVAFMTMLPTLDADTYQAFLVSAAGKGHHGDQSGDDDHDHGEATSSADGHQHDEQAAHGHGDHQEGEQDTQSSIEDAAEESDHHDDGHGHEH